MNTPTTHPKPATPEQGATGHLLLSAAAEATANRETVQNRLPTAQVLAAYTSLGEAIGRLHSTYDLLLSAPPQQLHALLHTIREQADVVLTLAGRLQRSNR